MIKATSFDFRSGLLLSKEILEQMTVQSHLFQIQYADYPDGILYGFRFEEHEGMLFLTPGMLKFQGKYYTSEQKLNITEVLYEADNTFSSSRTQYALLAFVPADSPQEPEGVISSWMKPVLFTKDSFPEYALILAEFQYYRGKRHWKAFSRSGREELSNQLNIREDYYSFLNVKYSLPHENVFSPEIYRMMKDCLVQKNVRNQADDMLLFMLSQHEVLSFGVLEQWFRMQQIEVDLHNRKDIIEKFLNYVNSVESEPAVVSREPRKYGYWNPKKK